MEFGKMRLAAFVGLALVAIFVIGCTSSEAGQEVPLTPSGEPVKLVSNMRGQYEPAVIKVKQGSTVRIEGDTESLVDTMDTIIVEGYGVQKTVKPGDNVLEFVADKPGEFKMRCANGMGNGKLIVEP